MKDKEQRLPVEFQVLIMFMPLLNIMEFLLFCILTIAQKVYYPGLTDYY